MVGVAVGGAVAVGAGAFVGVGVGLGGIGVSARAAAGAAGGVGGSTFATVTGVDDGALCAGAAGVPPPQARIVAKASERVIAIVESIKVLPIIL